MAGQSQSLAGFMDYVYKTIIPACFIVPMKSSFDLNDGHTFLVSTKHSLLVWLEKPRDENFED